VYYVKKKKKKKKKRRKNMVQVAPSTSTPHGQLAPSREMAAKDASVQDQSWCRGLVAQVSPRGAGDSIVSSGGGEDVRPPCRDAG